MSNFAHNSDLQSVSEWLQCDSIDELEIDVKQEPLSLFQKQITEMEAVFPFP